MASPGSCQQVGWLRVALEAASSSAANARDLKQLRWMAFEVSHAGMVGPSHRCHSSDDGSVFEEFEEVMSALALFTEELPRIAGALRLLRASGRGDLAWRVERASSRRNGRAHPGRQRCRWFRSR